jgi:hypothetical protein
MEISRDADGLRFTGECVPEKGFVAGDIQCAGVAAVLIHTLTPVVFHWPAPGVASKKTFWAEADMHVYLAENWTRLRQSCTHPSVTLYQSTLS